MPYSFRLVKGRLILSESIERYRWFIVDLVRVYEMLLKDFGRQFWWPAETRFEVMVGAILTQQTTWTSVEVAVRNLKREKLLSYLVKKQNRYVKVSRLRMCRTSFREGEK